MCVCVCVLFLLLLLLSSSLSFRFQIHVCFYTQEQICDNVAEFCAEYAEDPRTLRDLGQVEDYV